MCAAALPQYSAKVIMRSFYHCIRQRRRRAYIIMNMKLRWFLSGLLSLAAGAADWPQWRGPVRNGISQESGLLKEWPKDGPRLLWRIADIGDGYATPSVVGTRLYILGNR